MAVWDPYEELGGNTEKKLRDSRLCCGRGTARCISDSCPSMWRVSARSIRGFR
jgi:hypothetical protein